MPAVTPELAIIEGFFGRMWTAAERAAVIAQLAPAGYRAYHYAPKGDASLRREWQRPFSPQETAGLAGLAQDCRAAGMRFGVGLTPYGALDGFGADAQAALAAKLAALDAIGLDDLVVMFDDMPARQADAAERQADIMAFAAGRTRASRLFLVPSFYSFDPILDRVFGPRPENYWAVLAERVDPAVIFYWTGEEVCARDIRAGHIADVAALLRHPIALWDNYPVNDGPRMASQLHLRPFTGRSAALRRQLAVHAINPMSQPLLGCIAARTLPMLYARGEDYRYMAAFAEAAEAVAGVPLAAMLAQDLLAFCDAGLTRLGERIPVLRERYAAIDHPAAREVVEWLDGGYAITGEAVQTQ